MANKKATAKKVEVAPQEVVETIVQPKKILKVEMPKMAEPKWEYKARTYYLKTGKSPLVYTIPSRHSQKKPLLYFDEEKGYQRELRYATNHASPFVDEQKGPATLGRIVLRDGLITVNKEDVCLQKLLSLYHPFLNKVYSEHNPVKDSKNELYWIELELEALNTARTIEIEHAEAILRAEFGSSVSDLSSSELKRDLMIFAKRQPALFLDLADDDNVQLRNIGVKATEAGVLNLSADQRTFTYGQSNRKLMTVPFDEHPYSALAAYFKTDEGMEVYKSILKKLK
tara:strand:- start:3214 stop:4065 length:852 start_codon:yes stop_codon:yes gene_type:complete